MEKMRQWMMLTALGVVGIMAAGWFLLVSPQKSHAKDLQAQATAQQASTTQLQGQVNQLKQQQQGEPAQQAKLNKIATQIPDNPELPVLIRELSAAAHKTGVSLVSLAPGQPSTVAAAAAPTTPSAAAPAALAQIPISVQVTGSYFNIESFFRSVEHLDRAMLVTGFTFALGDAGPSTNTTTGATSGGAVAAAPNALTAQVNAVVFESPSVAAPAATTAQTPTTTTPATSTTAPATTASTAPSTASAQ